MDYTQVKGNVNELLCMISFIQLGYECSVPYGNGARYDFIVDYNGELLKIQCKSSHYVNNHGIIDYNSFQFSTSTSTTNTKEIIKRNYTENEIDYFATNFNGITYVVPVQECSTCKTLRLKPPSFNLSTYNKAEDYEITKRFEKSKELIISEENFKERQSREIIIYTCPNCGKQVSSKGKLCVDCSGLEHRKVERPNREILKNLIRTKSFLQIGKEYNVTDNAIRKWCISYNLPSKKSEINKITEKEWQNI